MRKTRRIWITNLPTSATEEDIGNVLSSYGKIQNINISDDDHEAVITFVDAKSASRAIDNPIKLNKTFLKLQFYEGSGVPHLNSTPKSGNGNKSDNRSASSSESKSLAGEIDTDSTTSTPSSSNGSSPQNPFSRRMTSNSSPAKKDVRKMHNCHGRHSYRDLHGPRKPAGLRGLRITQLPLRSSDTNLREGLFHEYKKHGKITSLVVKGAGPTRSAHITFKLAEDAEKANEHSKTKVFFGVPVRSELVDGLGNIPITCYGVLDVEDPDLCPPEHAMDEYHPKATKTLFVGNLCSASITQEELQRVFEAYGDIIEIDIKTQTNQPGTSYAFVQYDDIKSVVRALNDQEGVRVSGRPVKLGFGKSQPANVVWLDNLTQEVNENLLQCHFNRYGRLKNVIFDPKLFRALLYFDTIETAQKALNETRNRAILGRKVQIDYASHECQAAFMTTIGNHSIFDKTRNDRRRNFFDVHLPCGVVAPYIDDEKCTQNGYSRRSKDLNGIASCDSSRSGKYGFSRSSHHSNSRCDSPVRGSIYSSSRASPSRDYNNYNSPGTNFRTNGNALSNSVGLSNSSKHLGNSSSTQSIRTTSSKHERVRSSQYRKSVAPSLDYSRGFNGTSYQQQHSTSGHGNTENVSPPTHQSRSYRRSHFVASSASESSSLERKQNRKDSRARKSTAERSKRDRSTKHKSTAHRLSGENTHWAPSSIISSPILSRKDEPIRHFRESTISSPEPNSLLPSGSNIRDLNLGIAKTENGAQPTTTISMQPNETLTKLQREQMELLMQLSMLRRGGSGTPVPSSLGQPHTNGACGSSVNTSQPLPESPPVGLLAIPDERTSSRHYVLTGSAGSAGQSSSSDPGDVMFSPSTGGPQTASDRSSPPPPPPPPPPPLPRILSSPLRAPSPSPSFPQILSTFNPIASPPPWDMQTSTTIETDLPLLAAQINPPRDPRLVSTLSPFISETKRIVPVNSPPSYPLTRNLSQTDSDFENPEDVSLDERIRRLDDKMRQSEKIRPIVDYSKFRIRRKSVLPPPIASSSDTIASTNSGTGMTNVSDNAQSENTTMSPLRLIVSPTSPAVVSSTTSPGYRPSDTSEFVKSMLSSSRSVVTSAVRLPTGDNIVSMRHLDITQPLINSDKPIHRSPYHTAPPTCGIEAIRPVLELSLPQPPPPQEGGHIIQSSRVADVSSASSPAPHSPANRCSSVKPSQPPVQPVPPSSKSILKKESVAVPPVTLTSMFSNAIIDAPDGWVNESFCPNVLPQIHKPQNSKQSLVVSEKAPSLKSPSTLKVSVSTKRKLPGTTFPHPPKSPRLSNIEMQAHKVEEKETNTNNLSKQVPCEVNQLRHVNVAAPPSRPNTIKPHVREAPLMNVKQNVKRSIVSPPVTPFERNKLHFKKIPKLVSNDQESISHTQPPASAPPSSRRGSTASLTNSIKSPISLPKGRPRVKSDSGNKRKRLKRRKNESDEDDWKPQSVNLGSLQPEDIPGEGTQYETMYDKIKRRGNKDAGQNERPEVKPSAFKSLLKSRKQKRREDALRQSHDASDTDECSRDLDSRRKREKSKRPPYLIRESPERAGDTRAPNRGNAKKCRLKRPEGDSGPGSESEWEDGKLLDQNQLEPTASGKPKRTLPLGPKQRRRSGSDFVKQEKPTCVKNATKVRPVCKVFPTSRSSSSDEASIDGNHNRSLTTTSVPAKLTFPPRSPADRESRSASSGVSSTPRISRSCSPVNENTVPDDSTADELPLLEKQIVSDDDEPVKPNHTNINCISPAPELPVTEEMPAEKDMLHIDNMHVTESKKVRVEETISEVPLDHELPPLEEVVEEEPRSEDTPSHKPCCNASRPVGGLILTSPLIKRELGPLDKSDCTEYFEDSGLALLSSAAEAEAQKQEGATEPHKPAESHSVCGSTAQPVTLLTPVSVIPTPGSTGQQHITLVVNAVPGVSTAPAESVFGQAAPRPAFVLSPSTATFSFVSPVAVSADNTQLLFNKASLSTTTASSVGPLVDNAQMIRHQVSLSTTTMPTAVIQTSSVGSSSTNYIQYVQQIIERVKQKDDDNLVTREKVKRTKRMIHQSPPIVTTAGVSVIRPAPAPTTSISKPRPTFPAAATPVLSEDPYEPNFDEQEPQSLPKTSLLPQKDSVDEVINCVVHGEFAQEEYVQRLVNGTLLGASLTPAPINNNRFTGDTGINRAVVTSTSSSNVVVSAATKVSQQHRPINIAPAPSPIVPENNNPAPITAAKKSFPNDALPVTPEGHQPSVHFLSNHEQQQQQLPLRAIAPAQVYQSSVLPTSSIVTTPLTPAPQVLPGDMPSPGSILDPLRVWTQLSTAATVGATPTAVDILRPQPPQQISPTLLVAPANHSTSPGQQPPLHELAVRIAYLFGQQNQKLQLHQADVADSGSTTAMPPPLPQAPPNKTTVELYAAATMAAMAALSPAPTPEVVGVTAAVGDYNAVAPQPPQQRQQQQHRTIHSEISNTSWCTDALFVEDKFPQQWTGYMNLKNDKAYVRMFYLAGNRDLIHTCLQSLARGDNGLFNNNNAIATGNHTAPVTPVLRIAQRMRLESSQLDGVQWKLREPENYCMCLALAAPPPPPPLPGEDTSSQMQENGLGNLTASLNAIVLQRNIINYLQEKTAAGIISCPSQQENPFVMHIFPPCDFTRTQLQQVAPELLQTIDLNCVPHMLIVVV